MGTGRDGAGKIWRGVEGAGKEMKKGKIKGRGRDGEGKRLGREKELGGEG